MSKTTIARTGGCVICGSTEVELITDTLRGNVKRNIGKCRQCHLVYQFPLMTLEEEQKLYEEEYRKTADVKNHYLPQQARQFFETELEANRERFRRVESLLRPDARILEIGCAAGSFLYCARQKVAECVGVELHREFAAFVRNELKIPTYDKPLEKCDFAPESFDAIFLFHVLEHIREPVAYLELLRRLLKPKGLVFIELPNIEDALIISYRIKAYRKFYYQLAHSYYFSQETLKSALGKAGFRGKVSMLQRYGLPNHLNWLFRGRPQANPSFQVGWPLKPLDSLYRGILRLTGKSDTLFAVAQKEKPTVGANPVATGERACLPS